MNRRKQLLTLVLAMFLIGGLAAAPRFIQLPAKVVAQASPEATITPSVTHSSTAIIAPSRTPSKTLTQTITVTSTRIPTRTFTPRPTRTATPTATLPVEVTIKGIYGYGQLLPLSCESRSAADWARHFKVDIREMEFMARVPKSDDPEVGFVGSPYGSWGQIPPNPYGVHAGPVAAVLRSYGLKAEAGRNLTWDFLRSEISAGRPVIVWVVGHVEPGAGVQVEIGGVRRTVARYEHTVIVTGYDAKYVNILDGKKVYRRPIETFMASWQALENMAIFWNEDQKE